MEEGGEGDERLYMLSRQYADHTKASRPRATRVATEREAMDRVERGDPSPV